jgi:hypothetical protein
MAYDYSGMFKKDWGSMGKKKGAGANPLPAPSEAMGFSGPQLNPVQDDRPTYMSEPGAYDISTIPTLEGQHGAGWNMLYETAGRAMDAARKSPTAEQIYDVGKTGIMEEYEDVRKQNLADLQRAGLLTSGAGYTEDTPYNRMNENLMKALTQLRGQAEVSAPQIALQNLGAASGIIGSGTVFPRMGEIQGVADRQYQVDMDAARIEEEKKARRSSTDMGIGQGIGQLAGTLLPMAAAPFTGGASLGLSGLFGGGGLKAGGIPWLKSTFGISGSGY